MCMHACNSKEKEAITLKVQGGVYERVWMWKREDRKLCVL